MFDLLLDVAYGLLLANSPDTVEANFGISDIDSGEEFIIRLEQSARLASTRPCKPTNAVQTNPVSQHLATIMADDLEDLLDFLDEARVEDGFGQLDVTEMARALRHVLCARLALELSINGSKSRVVQALFAGLCTGLIHGLRIFDVGDAHILDLFRCQNTELDLLDSLEGRTRVREVEVRHLAGCSTKSTVLE